MSRSLAFALLLVSSASLASEGPFTDILSCADKSEPANRIVLTAAFGIYGSGEGIFNSGFLWRGPVSASIDFLKSGSPLLGDSGELTLHAIPTRTRTAMTADGARLVGWCATGTKGGRKAADLESLGADWGSIDEYSYQFCIDRTPQVILADHGNQALDARLEIVGVTIPTTPFSDQADLGSLVKSVSLKYQLSCRWKRVGDQ